MLTKIKKAQSTLEYALILAVIVGALLTMQNYLKRSVQGKLESTADEIGQQYSPGLTQKTDHLESRVGTITETTTFGRATDTSGASGRTNTVLVGGHQEQTSNRQVQNQNNERWVGQQAAQQ